MMDKASETFHYSPALQDTKDLDELKPTREESGRAALERIVWRKLDAWILPLCTSFFFLAFLVCS